VALSEKHRTRFYEHFVEHVGEEAAEDMLAQFPSRDVDELATKDFVAAQISGVRAEMADVRVEIAGLRSEMAHQTDRLMTRIQVAAAVGFGFLGVVLVLTR
jgi:hypothetical protein